MARSRFVKLIGRASRSRAALLLSSWSIPHIERQQAGKVNEQVVGQRPEANYGLEAVRGSGGSGAKQANEVSEGQTSTGSSSPRTFFFSSSPFAAIAEAQVHTFRGEMTRQRARHNGKETSAQGHRAAWPGKTRRSGGDGRRHQGSKGRTCKGQGSRGRQAAGASLTRCNGLVSSQSVEGHRGSVSDLVILVQKRT